MSRIGKVARRTFLVGSAAVVGGVAFGVYKYHQPEKNPLLDNLPDSTAALTPYVLITADGITLITPRADKGQGAYSVQTALIAEELDVELDQIRFDPGPPSAAYWNTALSEEAAAFLVPGDGLVNSVTEGVVDAAVKFLGVQITGGSTTVPDGFVKLRAAGASARETLKAAAAAKTGVAIGALRTEAASVILPDGTRLLYTDLAAEAAQIEPVTDVPLRDPSTWRLIGKPMQRVDIVAKSTGIQTYGIDVTVDGMVHATVALNPAQGGTLNSFDASEALTMRGVETVVPITGGGGVVADNTWRAFQAAQAISFDWGHPPCPPTWTTTGGC